MSELQIPTTSERVSQLEQDVADLKQTLAAIHEICGLLIRGGQHLTDAGRDVERRLNDLERVRR